MPRTKPNTGDRKPRSSPPPTTPPRSAKVPADDESYVEFLDKPKHGRGRPSGSKGTGTPYTARVMTALKPQDKKKLERAVSKRKLADETLTGRWGVSDLVREIVEEWLSRQS